MKELRGKSGTVRFTRKNLFFRLTAYFVLVTFSTLQIAWAQGPVSTETLQDKLPETEVTNFQASSPNPEVPLVETSTQFLSNQSPLSRTEEGPAISTGNLKDVLPKDVRPVETYDRYALEPALDLMRPEFASAAILEKPMDKASFESLLAHSVEEDIEILHAVFFQEDVMASSGSGDEIAASSAFQEIMKKAAFVLHTHPDEHSKEGPTGTDFEAAGDQIHYVLTKEKKAYAYNRDGVVASGDIDWLVKRYEDARRLSQETPDEMEVRRELNRLIAEQDKLNQIPKEEREAWLRGGTFSFKSTLTSSNVTTLPGSPYPYTTTGSAAGPSTITYNETEGRFYVNYDVTQTGAYSGMRISFDNASTSSVETKNLSALTSIVLGIQGPASSITFEFFDVNGKKDYFTLKDISNTAERFWEIPISAVVSTVDKTQIKQIQIYENNSQTTSTTRTGTFKLRIKGLNVSAPAAPGVTSTVPAYTNKTTLTLSGPKEAYTSILINGVEVVARDANKWWSYTVNLMQEGTNIFDIKAKNTIGKESAILTKSTIRDTAAPEGSVKINDGAEETPFRIVTLSLASVSDATSGLDKMRFSQDGGASWTSWETFAASKSLTLSEGNGVKEIKVEVRDKALNVTPFSDTILLDVPPPFQEVSSQLVIEAEHPHGIISRNNINWEFKTTQTGFSGTGYYVTPDNGKSYDTGYTTKAPELQYQIQVDNPGTYYVWIRGYGPSGASDTLHVGLDGVGVSTADRIAFWPYASWLWSKKTQDLDASGNNLRATLDITAAGVHTLNVWMREDGFILDKVLLTKNPDFVPTDLGPEESWRVDHISPTGSIQIKREGSYVSASDVTLLLNTQDNKHGSGVSEMRFSLDEGNTWTSWEGFASEKVLTLTGKNGIKKVLSQVKDKAGNTSQTFEDEVILFVTPNDGSLVSLNTQEGFRLNYLANELFSVEKPGEYTLIAPELDTNQNLTGGIILFQKGGAAYYKANKVQWNETPQQDRFSYNADGRVIEIRDRNKKKITFSYTLDANNQVLSIQAQAEGFTSTYNSQGKLLEVTKQNGDKLVYDNGILKSITLANGSVISYTKSALANGGTRAALASSAPDTYPQSIDYDAQGEITKVVKRSGEQILFLNGVPDKFIDKDGIESRYSYDANSGGDLTGLTLNKLDYVQHFDTQGSLFAIDLPTTDGVILEAGDQTQVKRFEAQDGKITKIILTDGTTVEFGEGGYETNSDQIKNGAVHFSDGSKARYENGALVEIVTSEGISYKVTLQGENYVATKQGSSSSNAATQFVLDKNFNALELTHPKDIVKLKDNKTQEILPNCNPSQDEDCEEARFFYYLSDKTVVVQGNFSSRPVLETLNPNSGVSYSLSTFDLQGQPLGMKTYEGTKLTRVDFSYGKSRHVFSCNLDETSCTETLNYTYEFDSLGNETTVVRELATGTIRRYRDNLLKEAVTKDNVITTYTHDSKKRVLTSKMTWQGRVLESYSYEYDDANQRTKITDQEGVTRIYDTKEKLVGIIQGNQEFSILHFTQDGQERTAQELIKETSDSGLIFHYQMGKVTKIEYPDGRILEEIVEDEKEGKIFSAKLTYPDGTSERIVNGTRVEIRRPDGSVWEYEQGRLVRVVDKSGRTFVYRFGGYYTYLYEAATDSAFRYDPKGNFVQTDYGTGIAPASLDPLTLYLSTISYADLATNFTKTSADETSDLFKAKIISSQNDQITLETVHGDQLIYQGGKLIKEIEAGTGHAKEYSYEVDNTILKESGSIQSFNLQKKLFRFVDFKGISYDVTPVLNGTEITGYDLVSGTLTVRLDTKGIIQSVTGGTATQAQFLDIHFDLQGVPLNLSEVKIQGSATIIKEGNFSVRLKQGANAQDQIPPQVHVSSPRIIDTSSYTLVYKVDGVEKSKAVTLVEAKNLLTIEETDTSGNKTTLQVEVAYIPPVPFEEKEGQLVIEAEHPHVSYSKEGQSWEYESFMEGESGEGYFIAGPNAGKTRDTDYLANSPELQYKVQITNPGTYYVWVRGYGPTGRDDTIHVGLDGQAIDTADRINFWPNGKWKWAKNTQDKDAAGNSIRATLEITTAGVHTLNVWMREDGFIFDKILLTKDPNFTPQDLGPNESFRNYTPPSSNPTSTLASLFDDYKKAQMAPEEVMYSVFDKEGKLVYTEKVNGTVTEYIQGRITSVWDRTGRLLQSYEYDTEGNPTKIVLHRMREEFPAKIQTAREDVEKQKNEALRGLAEAEANAVQQIQQTYGAERSRLEAQRSNLEGQRYQTVCQRNLCSETCRTVENPGVASAIAQVNQALSDLNAQEAQAYANLKTEVANARNTIDTEVTKAFTTINGEEKKFKDEILRQEISPVVFHYYRKILGRDPSEAEYNKWIQETDFNLGLDIAKLENFLNTTPELSQRQASVSQIKSLVTQFVNDYKGRAKDEKIAIAQTQLGLLPEDLTFFKSSEADKILQWLNSRSLHFGQSAYIALEKMLEQAGIAYSREELAKRLILVDILAGIITPFEEGELLISLFAIKHVAKLYGLNTQGLNTGFVDLVSFYKTHTGHRMIAHINGDHYVIMTEIKDVFDEEKQVWVKKVVYFDPGAGPEGNNQIMEVTQEEFLKVWDGNVLVAEATSQVLIQQHNEDPNLKANPPPQVLTKSELQEIRGAFFFFLIPFFAFVFSAVATIASVVVSVVTTVASVIGAVLGPLMGTIQGAIIGIVSGLEALAGAFLGFATTLLHAIPFIGPTLSGVIGAIGNFALGFVSGFVTGFVSTALTGTFSSFVVSAATLSFALGGVEGILTAIGVPPKVAHYIGVGFNIVGAIATGNPVLIASTLASTAVAEVGPRIGLSPGLTSALSIATSALAGTIAGGAFDPNTTVFQALKNAAPKLVGSFAQAGFIALGDAIGLDPRLTSLISIGTGAFAKGLTAGLMNANGGGFSSILNSVKNAVLDKGTIGGLISVGASIGLGEIGAPPILQSFLPNILGQIVAGSGGTGSGGTPPDAVTDGDNIFKRLFGVAAQFGRGVVEGAKEILSFGAKVLEGGVSFLKEGFAKAVDAFTGLIRGKEQEFLRQQGNGSIENAILSKAVVNGDKVTADFGTLKLEWDRVTDEYSVVSTEYQQSAKGARILEDGELRGIRITRSEQVSEKLRANYVIDDGIFKQIEFIDIPAAQILSRTKGWDMPEGIKVDDKGALLSGILENFLSGTAYAYEAGKLVTTSILRKDDQGAFSISAYFDPLGQVKVAYDATSKIFESLYKTQATAYNAFIQITSDLRNFANEVLNLDGPSAKVFNYQNSSLATGVTSVDMDLNWFNFFSLEKLPLTLTDLGYFALTANHRWSQEVGHAVPLLADQVSNKENKFIFVPGVNSRIGTDISFEQINTLSEVFRTANPDKQVVFCHSAGTEICLKSAKEAKADYYVFASPRVRQDTFIRMIEEAGLTPDQVLVVTATDDLPHWPTDLLSNPTEVVSSIANGGLANTTAKTLGDSFYDYQNSQKKYNYVYLERDWTYENHLDSSRYLGHGGMIKGVLFDHEYDIEYNGVKKKKVRLRNLYSDFVRRS